EYLDAELLQGGEDVVAVHRAPFVGEVGYRPMPRPPSTGTTAPVTYAAASEHRKAMTSATSSGVPNRPRGTCAASAPRRSSDSASVMAVVIGPGSTALQVIDRDATSRATDRVSPMRPALAEA